MKYSLPAITACVLIASQSGAAAQINVTPWQIHEGTEGIIPFATKNDEQRKAALAKATIPGKDDAGWQAAATQKDGSVNIDRKSQIKKGTDELDFTYLQTEVTIPANASATKFQVKFDTVDDGARVWIFNSKHPKGFFVPSADIVRKSVAAVADLSGEATTGANRIVVVQYDQHGPGNTIKGVRVLVDGQEVPPVIQPSEPSQLPIVLTSHGDVHMRTPDGLAYDFQGTGEFLCIQSDAGKAVVQTRQETWTTNPKVSVNTAAAISADGQKIEFYLKPEFRWFVNDQEKETPGANGGGGQTFPGGTQISYKVLSQGRLEYIIYWGDKSFAARVLVVKGSHMDVGVRRDSPAHTYQGMFGNLDKDPKNDMTLRDGGMVAPPANAKDLNTFTDSWRVKPEESLFGDAKRDNAKVAAKNPHTEVQIDEAKRAEAEKLVKAAGITDPLAVRNATYDVAITGNKTFIESAKALEEAVKALPEAEKQVVAGDHATQAVLNGGTPAGGPAGELTNLALNKAATQSSTAFNGPASLAVDGNTGAEYNADPSKNQITHTEDAQDNWWQVDLGKSCDIEKIVIWNRTDMNWERLVNFHVIVSDTPIESNSSTGNLVSGPHGFTDGEHPSMDIEAKAKGRYVRIFLKDSQLPLSLGEVQVFGR